MFDYRGRELNINSRYLEDFRKYHGFEFSQNIADDYIYNRYIGKRDRYDDIPAVVAELSNGEIEEALNGALRNLLCFYTCDVHYGE